MCLESDIPPDALAVQAEEIDARRREEEAHGLVDGPADWRKDR